MIKEYLTIKQSLDYLEKLTDYRYDLDDLKELNILGELNVYFYKKCMVYKKQYLTEDNEDSTEIAQNIMIFAGIFSPLSKDIMQSFGDDGYSFSGVVKVVDFIKDDFGVFTPPDYCIDDYFYVSNLINGLGTAIVSGEKGLLDFTQRLLDNKITFFQLEELRFSRDQLNEVARKGYNSNLLDVSESSNEHSTPEQLKEAQTKITELEKQLAQAKADLKNRTADINMEQDHLYNWQAMDKNQYPPELHLAIEIWIEYYQADVVEHISQFDAGRFNRIASKFNLSNGNLKSRIRSLLTPLESKLKSPSLIDSLKEINIIHTDKLEQD